MHDVWFHTIRVIALIAAMVTGATAHAQTVAVAGGTPTPPIAEIPNPQLVADRELALPSLRGRFLLGAVWGPAVTIDKNLGTQYKVSPFVRLNSRRRGWVPSVGLNWTRTDLRVPLNGRAIVVGSVKIRPVMAGIGYRVLKGRTRTTFGLVGGYAFNHATVDRALPDDVRVDVAIANAWVVQPKAEVMLAVTRRVALITSLGYVLSNPNVSVTVTRSGQQSFQARDYVRADSVSLRFGAAVSVF